jgi:hypothetical protein
VRKAIQFRSREGVKTSDLSIMDHGTGIPREHLSKIFDPYFTTKKKGSGLGLSTSYSIVRSHGGHLMVESDMGIGTTFMIYLPASDEGKRLADAPPLRPLSRFLPPLRFLLHGAALVAAVPDIHLPISNLEAYQGLDSAVLTLNL